MMRVKKTSKKVATTPPDVAAALSRLNDLPTAQLAEGLRQEFPPHQAFKYPRGDLHAWIPLLNKLDGVLEQVVADYGLEELENKPWETADEEVVLEILRVERSLMDNSTSRKIYASYDRLQALLSSSHQRIIHATLLVLLRVAMQYTTQTPFELSTNPVIRKRILRLVNTGWGRLKEVGWDMNTLARGDTGPSVPDAWFEITESFYRTLGENVRPSTQELERPTSEMRLQSAAPPETPSRSSVPSRLQLDGTATPVPASTDTAGGSGTETPRPMATGARVYTSSEGLTTVVIPSTAVLAGTPAIDLVRGLIEAHPELRGREERFEIFQKVRLASMIAGRQDMTLAVQNRLLALAVYLHVTIEETAQNELFLFDPTLISQVAALAQASAKVDDRTLATAIMALDAAARQRGNLSAVMSALQVNLPHGNLLSLFRNVTARMRNGVHVAHVLVDSIFSLLSFVVSAPQFGSMVVGAGIIPILLDLIQVKDPAKGPYVARSAGLLDSVLYANSNAFTLFTAAGGLDILNGKIIHELERLESGGPSSDSDLQPLRLVLRSIYRMMQGTGTTEGLRSLIDSPLPASLGRILRHPAAGAAIHALAVNVTATFVHNEPTSLPVIQEHNLPQATYDAVMQKPSFDLLAAVSNAISAFCLNQSGLDYTTSRPEIIRALIHSPLDPALRESLRERDNAAYLGSTLDELTRHHPQLKDPILESTLSLLKEIKRRGETGRCKSIEEPGHYGLIEEGTSVAWEETEIDILIDDATELVQGLFQNTALIDPFLKLGGLDALFDLYDMPALVNYFADTQTAAFLGATIRIMAEGNHKMVLRAVVERVRSALVAVQDWKASFDKNESFLQPMTESPDAQANGQYRRLVYLNNMLGLLSNIFFSSSFAHGKVATGLLSAFKVTEGDDTLLQLGQLQRLCIWETCLVDPTQKDGPQTTGVSSEEGDEDSAGAAARSTETSDSAMQVDSAPVGSSAAAEAEPGSTDAHAPAATDASSNESEAPKKPTSPRASNTDAVKAILRQIPQFALQLFQGVSKMLLFRRSDAAHKAVADPTAAMIAQIMLDHLADYSKDATEQANAYRTRLMSVVWILLFDERTTQGSLQTLLLVHLRRKGGLEHIVRLAHAAMADAAAGSESSLAYLKVIVDLIRVLTLTKTVFDSSQTLLLTTRDKAKDAPDYFDAHDLLITLRLTFFDTINELWRAPWLPNTSLEIVQPVVQALLAVLQPLPKPEATPAPPTASAGAAFAARLMPSGNAPPPVPVPRQPTTPNEEHMATLEAMGFQRYAARVALTRLHNNLPAAAEYLLSHAHLLVEPEAPPAAPAAAPAPAPAAEVIQAAPATQPAPEVETVSAPVSAETAVSEPTPNAAEPAATTSEMAGSSKPVARSEEDVQRDRTKLEDLVNSVRPELLPTALALLDKFDGLVFDLSVLFFDTDKGIDTAADSLRSVFEAAPGEDRDKSMSSRLRLMAVLSHHSDYREKVTDAQMADTLKLLTSLQVSVESPRPRWLSGLLLSIESLLIWSDGIKPVDDATTELTVQGPDFTEERSKTMDIAIALLGCTDLNQEEAVATLRVLVVLTRHEAAKQMVLEKGALPTLFNSLQHLSTNHYQTSQALKNMIIRHLVENATVMRELMKREITAWFGRNTRSDWTQADHLVSQLRPAALRDPQAFVASVKDECLLTSSEGNRLDGGYNLKLRKAVKDAKPEPSTEDPFSASGTESAGDAVMQYMVTEIVAVARGEAVEDPQQTRINSLLLVLTELFGSYLHCKKAILTAPKKNKDGRRSALLNVLVHDFVGGIHFDADVVKSESQTTVADNQRGRTNLFSWSVSAIVALCAEPGPGTAMTEAMAPIRKTVLETISKAIKDACSSAEPLDRRYGQLWALAELCFRLLTSRASVTSKSHDETTLHIAKIMLEKGFVPLWTNAMVDIDLAYPHVKTLVVSILQPLEILTKVSTRMGASDKASRKPAQVDLSTSSESEMDDEMEDAADEEALGPDLYRNSALSIFGGHNDQEDGDDDDMEEDDEEHYDDGEMEDEDSELTEPSDDDDDMSGWEEEDEEAMFDDEDGDEIDDEDSQFSIQEGDEQLPLEMAIGDDMDEEEDVIFEGGDEDDRLGDEFDEFDEDDEDRSDIYEEFEGVGDLAMDQPLGAGTGALPPNPSNWGWTRSHAPPTGQPDAPATIGAPRRRGRGMETSSGFGGGQPSSSSIASHPWLQSEPARGGGGGGGHGGLGEHRHAAHIVGAGGQVIGGLMQSLDRLVGGDALHLLESLVARTGARPTETIRIDYDGAQGAVGIQVGGRQMRLPSLGQPPRPANDGDSSERMPLDAMPQPTMNRWQEEEKVAAGLGSASRILAIQRVIVNALMPEAKKAQEAAEKEAAEARAKEEKARQEAEERERKAKEEEAAKKAEAAAKEAPETDVEMAPATAVAGPSAPAAPAAPEAVEAPRVIIKIHGADVDITDTGIDPAFLEALPDDMRADVVAQHMQENRMAAGRSDSSSSINPEFLDALPEEIRQEVLQQEAMEAQRNRQPESALELPELPTIDEAAQMMGNNDTFGGLLAGLERELGMTGVMGIGRLPAPAARSTGPGADAAATAQPSGPSKSAAGPPKESIQLLDTAGVASVVRLLFFPDIARRNHLLRILGNLAENPRSRADVINLLLAVLQDETGDLSLMDKQAASRYAKQLPGQTPKATPKRKTFPDTPAVNSNALIGHMQTESIPSFVASRAFEGLSYVTTNNEPAAKYFLTKQEVPVASTSRRPASAVKRGKEKEARTQQVYPIVLLLSLLDRQSLLSAPQMPESLTALLAALTKPLTQRKEDDATDAPEIPPTVLQSVPNILTQGDCTSRTFSNTLALVSHLSRIPGARDIITTELRHQAQMLGDELATRLQSLRSALQASAGDPSLNVPVDDFSPASSAQAKLLRILKTIDYTYASRNPNASNWDAVAVAAIADGSSTLTPEEEQVSEIFDTFLFAPMWAALSECLAIIGETPSLVSIATVLLPLVESLMVISRYPSAKAAAGRRARAGSVPMSPMSPRESMISDEDLFLHFTSQHRKLLNVMVRNNPSLMSGSFALLVLNPSVLEFDNKRSYFTQQLRRKPNREATGVLQLNVRRDHVFEDSYRALQGKTGDMIKYGKLSVKFVNEEGVDAGGVTREWYGILAEAIFNPDYALFEPCAADAGTYQPSQRSWVNADHLSFFKFIGRVIGKAIYDGRLLDAYFSRAFYKQILGRRVELRDMESIDPDYAKSLKWM